MAPATFVVVGLLLVWVVATGRAGQVMNAMRGAGGTQPSTGGQATTGQGNANGRSTYPEVGL